MKQCTFWYDRLYRWVDTPTIVLQSISWFASENVLLPLPLISQMNGDHCKHRVRGFMIVLLEGHKKSNKKQIKGERRRGRNLLQLAPLVRNVRAGEELVWGKRKKRKMNFFCRICWYFVVPQPSPDPTLPKQEVKRNSKRSGGKHHHFYVFLDIS